MKNLLANVEAVGDAGSIPRSGRSPGGGNGNPLQYSCQDDPTDKGAWWATVHEVTKSQTRLNTHTEREVKQHLQMYYRGGMHTYSNGLWKLGGQ